jgi:tetratricopeptide (TPR) repeat protein
MKSIVSVFLIIFFTALGHAQEKSTSGGLSKEELSSKLAKVDKNIESTKNQIKTIKDASYLSDLYFVLAEFLVEKSRILYQLKILNNPNVPVEDLDFTFEKRPKEEAIGVYEVFLEKFPSETRRDRALFFKAHELRELGRAEDMLAVYRQITKDYPNSQYWAESQLIIGDIYFEQEKDFEMAIEVFKQIVERPLSEFTALAYYKLGWCYINLNKFLSAYQSYEKAITSTNSLLAQKKELRSDIRDQALQAMVWPYSEIPEKYIDKIHSRSITTLEHFRSISFGYSSYVNLLKKLARRMKIKNRNSDAADAYFEYLRVSTDLEDKLSLLSDLYQLLRNKIKDVKRTEWPNVLAKLLEQLELDNTLDDKQKKKYSAALAKVLRDIATQAHRASKENSQWESLAYDSYVLFQRYFPKDRYYDALIYNKAGLGFRMGNAFLAGKDYEELARKKRRRLKTSRTKLLKSSLESYLSALSSGGLPEYQKVQARDAIRSMGSYFIKKNPRDKATPTILFNIGQTYYNERDFDKAIFYFKKFIKSYPKNTNISLAVNQVLDAHNQKEDYKALVKDANWILKQASIANTSLLDNVKEIASQAKILMLKKQSGDFNKGSYAKNMLQMAKKFKGTDLGDKALYEAFILYRSQRSEEMYKPGEMLLKSHENSQYAKQVAGDMVRVALVSADFARAAKYLEYFGRKYPKDKEANLFLKQASEIRKLIKDYKGAKRIYKSLGDYFSIAEMDYHSESWKDLLTSSKKVNEPNRSYWQAKSLHELGKSEQARRLLASKMSIIRRSGIKDVFAKSAFLQAQLALEQFDRIQFKRAADDQKVVEQKTKGLTALTKVYNSVIETGHPDMTLAALSGLGQIYKSFSQFISKANIPKGITAAQKKMFKDAIAQQVELYRKQSDSFFSKCLSTAKQARVYSKYLKYCAEKSQNIKLPQVKAEFSFTVESQISNLRKSLFDRPRDKQIYQQLIKELIKQKRWGDALATTNRALELFPEQSSFYLYMGILKLHLGNFREAGEYIFEGIKQSPYEKHLKQVATQMDRYFRLTEKKASIDAEVKSLLPRWLL